MTRKIMDISDGNVRLICIKTDDKYNPYRLYKVWWDNGYHRKQIDKYGDLSNVMFRVTAITYKAEYGRDLPGYNEVV